MVPATNSFRPVVEPVVTYFMSIQLDALWSVSCQVTSSPWAPHDPSPASVTAGSVAAALGLATVIARVATATSSTPTTGCTQRDAGRRENGAVVPVTTRPCGACRD